MSNPDASHRINNFIERAAIGLLVILLSLVQTQYWADKAESKQEIKELNIKVLELYRSSVTKQELRELEVRLLADGAAVRADVKNQTEAIRADVRQILTFYLEKK